jgi:RNA polymerase sigma factor for flagellar operon FliA
MKHDHISFAAAAQAYGDTRAVEDRVRRFLPMVRKAAWHIQGSGCVGIELDDLIQVGLLALTECARRHAGPGEDGFAAYAKIRVRGAMLDLVRRTIPGSRGAAARRRRLADAEASLRQRLGRDANAAELAAELGVSELELGDFVTEPIRTTPLDGTYDEGNPIFADASADPFAQLSDEEDSTRLAAVIDSLPDRLKLVLQLYFLEELNLAEIAEVLEVSVPRVHQLKAQALKQVREALDAQGIDV